MFEAYTYEYILKQMLKQVSLYDPNMDTRESSPIWYGLAPAAVELRNAYLLLQEFLNETYADSAMRQSLIRRASERGLIPYPATKAVCRAVFTPVTLDIPLGARFSLNRLNYAVIKKIADGEYQLECETEGEQGNQYFGALMPIEYLDGLETAKLVEILVPGEEIEDTEVFRQRYFDSLDAQSFGGNVADYKEKVNKIPGVGGVKVYRAWNGDIKPASLVPPEAYDRWFSGIEDTAPDDIITWLTAVSAAAGNGLLTVGGTVRLVIIDSTFSEPTDTLIDLVQQMVDPSGDHAEGLGIAPIGHFVTVQGVRAEPINIDMHVQCAPGWDIEQVKPGIIAALTDYMAELSENWAHANDAQIVRISQIETRVLSSAGSWILTALRSTVRRQTMSCLTTKYRCWGQ